MTHASESLSLATLEVLVHLQTSAPLASYVFFRIDIPDECIASLSASDLPENWRDSPAPAENRLMGNEWVRSAKSVVLRVPSAVVSHEHNFIINPDHPDFRRIAIPDPSRFDFDTRLVRDD